VKHYNAVEVITNLITDNQDEYDNYYADYMSKHTEEDAEKQGIIYTLYHMTKNHFNEDLIIP